MHQQPIKKPRVGLLLGMGAIAGAHFHRKFEESFAGLPDHEHPTVLSYSNPTQPRNTKDGTLPIDLPPVLLEAMDFFRHNDVDFILAPCNTLMFYRESLERYSNLPILDIVEAVVTEIELKHPQAHRIGLMSTAETSKWRLYHDTIRNLSSHSEIVDVDDSDQAEIARVIQDVRLGAHTQSESPKARATAVAQNLVAQGAQVIIKGCTEIPCVLDRKEVLGVPLIDSSLALAQAGARWVRRIERKRGERP